MKVTLVITGIICLAAACLSGQDRQPIGGDRLARFRSAEDLTAAGQDSAARVLYLAALTGPDGAEIADSLTALAYHRIATGYYNAAEDTLAMPYFRRSLALRDSLFAGPHNQRALVRTNMGLSMYYYGDLDSSTLLIQEANAIYEKLDNPDTVAWIQSLNEVGDQAIRKDDYSLGYASTYRAVELCRALSQVDAETLFQTYYAVARVRHHFGELDTALAYARTALHNTGPADHYDRALCHNLIALTLRQQGDYAASLSHLQRALTEGMRQPDALRPVADSHLYLAEHFALTGETAARKRHDALARDHYARIGSAPVYYMRTQLPIIAEEAGHYRRARAMLDETLDNLCPDGGSGETTACTVHRINALLLRARVLARLGDPESAMVDYRLAFDLQDDLRERASDPASRRYLSSDLRPEVDRAVGVLYRRYLTAGRQEDLWEAFQLSERARGYSLLASLQHPPLDSNLQTLQRRVVELDRKVTRGEEGQKSELEAHRITLARLLDAKPAVASEHLRLDLDRLLAYLKRQDTYLLEYHLADSVQLCFILSPAGALSVHELKTDTSLHRRVSTWTRTITESAFRRKSLRNDAEQAALDSSFFYTGLSLANDLLPAEVRSALPRDARVCIVPDASLGYLPFAALPMEDTAPGFPLNYRDLNYFQNHVRISYAYSAAFQVRIGSDSSRTYPENVLAFAPSFGTAPAVAQRGGNPLRPLLFNEEEVQAIADLIPGARIHRGEAASRERFLREVGRSKILHLSTHGVANPLWPQLSFVAFAQTDDRLDESELLYFNDLLGLPIDSELTVLSACETSLGQLAPGETTLSFASALAAAGARSTLTTLWQVDDHATKELMVDFYRRLLTGEDRLDALCGAQRNLRSTDYFHPFYWSSPTLYGATGTIPMAAPATAGISLGWSYLALGGAILTGLISYYFRKQSRL